MKKSQIGYLSVTGTKQGPLIPKQFQPTKRFATILGIMALSTLALGLIQFPYGSMLSGNTDVSIDIGYPRTFLQLSLENPDQFPLDTTGLLIDLLIYSILSYAIDIGISTMLNAINNKTPSTVQTFKPKPKSLANKATQKILQITQPLEIPKPESTTQASK